MIGCFRLLVMMLTTAAYLVPGPAWAADELALSLDGRRFHQELPGSVFGTVQGFVPGDSLERTLWVRNNSDLSGALRIELVSADSSRLFGPGLARLTAEVAGQGYEASGAGQIDVVADEVVTGGQTVPVRLALEFPIESGNVSQTLLEDFRIRVTLTQRGGLTTDPESGPSLPDVLPATGAGFGLLSLGLAPFLLGLGWALIRRQRGEKSNEVHAIY